MSAHRSSAFVAALLLSSLLGACSKPEATVAAAPATPAAPASVPIAVPASRETPACAMVTPEQMGAIVGASVVAKAQGADKCIFNAVRGPSPYVELKIDRGDGEIAMKSVGAMSRHEPGIADPLAGLGDQAAQVGPAFMIRSGHDLVSITFSGVDDVPKKAHAVFDLVKPQL